MSHYHSGDLRIKKKNNKQNKQKQKRPPLSLWVMEIISTNLCPRFHILTSNDIVILRHHSVPGVVVRLLDCEKLVLSNTTGSRRHLEPIKSATEPKHACRGILEEFRVYAIN